jgi:hypothetical protein
MKYQQVAAVLRGGGLDIPLSDASKVKDDGRLPMTDHNTRIL